MFRPETGISNYTDSEVKEYVETFFDLKVQIMEDIPGSPSVLSEMEQQQINLEKLDNGQEVIICFTPVIENLSNQHDLIFVNSEEHAWIHNMTGEIDQFQKPDGFSTPASLYNDAGQDSRVKLAPWKERHPTTYRYGGGIWEIRDFYVLWEFTTTNSPAEHIGIYCRCVVGTNLVFSIAFSVIKPIFTLLKPKLVSLSRQTNGNGRNRVLNKLFLQL
jgi:hypothetical protein